MNLVLNRLEHINILNLEVWVASNGSQKELGNKTHKVCTSQNLEATILVLSCPINNRGGREVNQNQDLENQNKGRLSHIEKAVRILDGKRPR